MTIKTEGEIKKKIEELISDSENFVYEDYGITGDYEVSYSKSKAKDTLEKFVKWLFEEYFKT